MRDEIFIKSWKYYLQKRERENFIILPGKKKTLLLNWQYSWVSVQRLNCRNIMAVGLLKLSKMENRKWKKKIKIMINGFRCNSKTYCL